MGETVDIGRRIELVPMDSHFHDISIGLYCQERDEGPAFLVHTYSRLEGEKRRIAFVRKAMKILGGMELTSDGLLRFPCWAEHELACKRIFLEACKLDPDEPIEPRPLNTLDKKSGLTITVLSLGNGVYQITADGEGSHKEKRISAIGGGLIKLGQMDDGSEALDRVAFSCGHIHDAMVGLLLVRAPNVRTVIREQEAVASRGTLSSPSQQE
jgi:hypothetical protein